MIRFLLRRIAYGGLVCLGVLFFLFALFFTTATPEDMARRALGEKAPQSVITQWVENKGYNKDLWPSAKHPVDNLLVEHYQKMLSFDFGRSDSDNVPITEILAEGALPSLLLTVPIFVVSLLLSLGVALFVAFFRGTYIDTAGVILSVLIMSVSVLLYIVGTQFLLAKVLRWFPISGFDWQPWLTWRFLVLPVFVGVLSGLGSSVRFYRTVFVEEIGKDYVRTARAKGSSELRTMVFHILPNAMIPIVTNVVMSIPFLFEGSLLLEAFFGIPGLGAVTFDAIGNNDFSMLRAMVFIGALLFVLGQILTDIAYTLVDPRIRVQ